MHIHEHTIAIKIALAFSVLSAALSTIASLMIGGPLIHFVLSINYISTSLLFAYLSDSYVDLKTPD